MIPHKRQWPLGNSELAYPRAKQYKTQEQRNVYHYISKTFLGNNKIK